MKANPPSTIRMWRTIAERIEAGEREADLMDDYGIVWRRDLLPPQEMRNFCGRCGKRSPGVHTCTPPPVVRGPVDW